MISFSVDARLAIYHRSLWHSMCLHMFYALPEAMNDKANGKMFHLFAIFWIDCQPKMHLNLKCTYCTKHTEQLPISGVKRNTAASVTVNSRVNDINLFQGRFQKRILCKGQTMTYTNWFRTVRSRWTIFVGETDRESERKRKRERENVWKRRFFFFRLRCAFAPVLSFLSRSLTHRFMFINENKLNLKS